MVSLRSAHLILSITLIAAGCGAPQASDTDDIFAQDAASGNGNARRHRATNDERLWTIQMGGCTGHLIAPNLMMSANHCSPGAGDRYTSGAALVAGQSGDITVSQVVERSAQLDFAVMRIQWVGGVKKEQRFPPLVLTKKSDLVAGSESQGDVLFTVGFPGDKANSWGATYSEGRAKYIDQTHLLYNIGTINGNSGGGVWRKKDNMLVSMTNAGPRQLGQAGWNQGNINSPNSWNNGAGMWAVYNVSPTIRDTFPGGRNRFAIDTGAGTGAKLFLGLGAADRVAADAFVLGVAGPANAARIIVCASTAVAQCNDAAPGLIRTGNRRLAGDAAIFTAGTATPLKDDLTLAIVAFDANEAVIGTRSVTIKAAD